MTPATGTLHDPEIARSVDSDLIRTKPRPERLLSVDVLRGLTIAFMILVNNQPGPGAFVELKHAQWNGFTLTDLVFPTFLFLVGLSLVLSTEARLARGATRTTLLLHTVRRSAVLAFFGLIVNTFPFQHLDSIRFYGVLQRTALCYLIVSALCLLFTGWKPKAAVAALCLVAYWVAMRYVPIPGFGVPTHSMPINDPNLNLTAWLDRLLFAPQHLYQRVRDPEGLLSTLPAISTTLYGVLAGMALRTNRSTERKAGLIAAWGVVLAVAGLAWNIVFPINKKLWTSSFSLFAGGLSLLLLALAVYVVDVKRWGRTDSEGSAHPAAYRPLMVFGTNSILAYMVSELLPPALALIPTQSGNVLLAYAAWLHQLLPMHGWPELVFGMTIVLATWLVVYPFYRNRVFLRV
jgi:predicted acyltransferase